MQRKNQTETNLIFDPATLTGMVASLAFSATSISSVAFLIGRGIGWGNTKRMVEEVQNIAKRSAQSARGIAKLIETVVSDADNRFEVNKEMLKNLEEIKSLANRIGKMMDKIAAAPELRRDGIDEAILNVTGFIKFDTLLGVNGSALLN